MSDGQQRDDCDEMHSVLLSDGRSKFRALMGNRSNKWSLMVPLMQTWGKSLGIIYAMTEETIVIDELKHDVYLDGLICASHSRRIWGRYSILAGRVIQAQDWKMQQS